MIDAPPEPQKPPQSTLMRNLLLLTLGFVITLLAGIAIGWQIRPETVVQVVVTATPDAAAVATEPPPSSDSGSATTPDLMTMLLSDARHFQGAADAPITFIEFSDFK